jgi:hypothetical protein
VPPDERGDGVVVVALDGAAEQFAVGLPRAVTQQQYCRPAEVLDHVFVGLVATSVPVGHRRGQPSICFLPHDGRRFVA